MSLVSQISALATRIANEIKAVRLEMSSLGGGAPDPHASTHAAGGSDAVTLAQSQVTNLTSDLAGKANTSHTHAISDVTSLQTGLNSKANLSSPTFTGVVLAPQIRLSSTTAASTTSTAQGLQVGSTTTGTRMKFGPNTLQVVTSTSSATTLELQPNGGFVRVGSSMDTDIAQTTVNGTAAFRNIRISTANPSGGLNGDVWLKYS